MEKLCAQEIRDAVNTLNVKIEAAIKLGINVKIGMASENEMKTCMVTNIWGQPVTFSVISLTKTSEY